MSSLEKMNKKVYYTKYKNVTKTHSNEKMKKNLTTT